MKTSRYRVKLPVIFGLAAGVLIAWQLHNEKIISQMGMAWDTGAPIWPYETPAILVFGFYFPAHFLAAPLYWAFDLQMVAERYLAVLPCSLLWWHLVGRRLDFGLVPSSWRRMGKRVALLPVLLGLVITYSGGAMALEGVRWWSRYGDGLGSEHSILLIRYFGPAVWCFLMAVWLGVVALRMAARE